MAKYGKPQFTIVDSLNMIWGIDKWSRDGITKLLDKHGISAYKMEPTTMNEPGFVFERRVDFERALEIIRNEQNI